MASPSGRTGLASYENTVSSVLRQRVPSIAIVSPYILSILPPGTVPISPAEASPPVGTTHTQPSFTPSAVVQTRSSLPSNLSPAVPFLKPSLQHPVPRPFNTLRMLQFAQ